jgi:hypothetical protein
MKHAITMATIALAVAVWAAPVAFADSDKDKNGPGSGQGDHASAYKQEYRQGDCEIKRKWEDGKYKEETKCKDDHKPPSNVSH